jgi:PAB1-binding protein PBP1
MLVMPCSCSREGRDLVAWMPDPDDSTDATMFGLEEASAAGWDQFAVNESKFGYQTGWDENVYTVKLDKKK